MTIGYFEGRTVQDVTFQVATLTGVISTLGTFTDNSTGTLADGSYTNLATTTSGTGTGATVDVEIVGNAVDSVVLNSAGTGYVSGDTIVVDATLITGGTGGTLDGSVSDIVGNIATVDTFAGTNTDWEVGDLITTNEYTTDGVGSGAYFEVASVGVSGDITSITVQDGGTDFAVGDTVSVADGTEVGGLNADVLNHSQYELGGAVKEYINIGTGFTVDFTDGDADNVLDDGEVTINTGGVNYIIGDQVRVIQSDNDTAVLRVDVVDENGVVQDFSIISGGEGYTDAVGLVTSQIELKSIAPDSYWQGTLTGSFDPSVAPDSSVDDNNPRITVVRTADEAQLVVQKQYADGGSTTVWAEPTIVNSYGTVVGNNVRAEDCVDQFRCEANGFVWVQGTTGDSDAGTYGYCRELTAAEFAAANTSGITTYAECTTPGTIFDGVDSCDVVTQNNDATTGSAAINTAVSNGDLTELKAMRDCEVGGNFWDVTTGTCIAGDVPSNFDISTFTFGSPTPGQTQNIYTSHRDYLANACRNLGYVWNYDDNTCNATVDPATLTTQVDCKNAGYIWIAGTCYNPNDFGDGHSRNATYQDDPNDAPE